MHVTHTYILGVITATLLVGWEGGTSSSASNQETITPSGTK